MPYRSLPNRPSLQSYRKQAKELLKQWKAGEPAAVKRFREHHPRSRRPGMAQLPFRLSDAQHVLDAHAYHVHAVAWGADDRRALSCSQEIRLWDLDRGTCLRTFEGHSETIRSIAWSTDQRLVVSAAHDRTVRVWDVDSGACLRVFAGHSTGAINAAWMPDGRIVSCDWSGEVRTWSMAG